MNWRFWKKRIDNGRYIVQKELGSGGFGITYLALDTQNNNQRVVIKTIHLNNLSQNQIPIDELIRIFQVEAESLRDCGEHENIVKFLDIFMEQSRELNLRIPHIVMEYIEGKTLRQLVDDNNAPLSEEVALSYIKQIGRALIFLHEKNVLHKDITPRNIIVCKKSDRAVLIDFGFARNFSPDVSVSHTMLGHTQSYAPPEQIGTGHVRHRYRWNASTDIYSLAATLYYLLTNKKPTDANKRQQNNDPLKPPKDWNYNISNNVNEAIISGMKLNFEERPQTVQEWLEKLSHSEIVIQQEPPQEGSTESRTPIQPDIPSSRRHILIASGTIFTIGLVGLVGFSLYQQNSNSYNTSDSTNQSPVSPNQNLYPGVNCATDIDCKSQGSVYYNKKDYDHAIAYYNQAIKLNPNDAEAYSTRGSAYDLKKDYDRAIADLNQAIKLDPNLAAAYSNRGYAYNFKQKYDKAFADLNQAIKLDPNLAAAYKNRGNTYYFKKDYDRAIADYNKAIQLDPKYALAYNNRGNVYRDKKDYDRAITDYNKAIQLDPKYALAYNNRGNAYKDKGNKDKAVEDFKKVLELNNDVELSQQASKQLQELSTE